MNHPTQPPAADSVMDIHSCSYYCQLPKCVLRQRDELVRVYVEGWKEKEPVTVDGAGFNGMTDRETSATASVFGLTQPTTPPAVEGGDNDPPSIYRNWPVWQKRALACGFAPVRASDDEWAECTQAQALELLGEVIGVRVVISGEPK